ncbi:MAG: sigma-54-dependent Fis family transcriptional regulator [Verrucomicrobia bacterium]|nr:sigma-54-dependent Fis family transcriptional regulator [Verrucomicrobiota bacterium]
MIVSVYAHGVTQAIEERVARLGFHGQRFTVQSVKELGHDSPELVYLVPHDVLATAEWPQLRVRLAQANRYYIVVADKADSAQIITAARDGAYDFLLAADTDERWSSAMHKVAESQKLWLQLYGGAGLGSHDTLLGESAALKSLRQSIERLGPTTATVLLLGESGVGKERVAAALHKASGRGPFVAVNCAAIPKELLEAELFGAEKGSYTGASKTRIGLVEQAGGGTLFLDEIVEMDPAQQPKLLRFLETRHFRRVGGDSEIEVEVRVISATNGNLEKEIAGGKFRLDLYYRISEVILHITPLKTRPDDIPTLALAFLQSASERFGKNFETLEPELVRKFQQYDWPGNVRELKNTIDRMVILYDGPVLREGWWEVPPKRNYGSPGEARGAAAGNGISQARLDRPLLPNRRQKLQMAKELLESKQHDLTGIAAELGIHPTTLYRWRKQKKV